MGRMCKYIFVLYMIIASGCSNQYELQKNIEPKNINIIAPYDTIEYQNTINYLIKKYNDQHTDVVVSVTFLPKYQYLKTLIVRYLPEQKSDLVIIDNKYIPLLASEGYLSGVDNIINNLTYNDINFKTFLLNQGLVDGKYYSIPFASSSYAVYINDTLVNTYSRDNINSWDDLAKTTEIISNKGVIGFAIPAREDIEVANLFLDILAKADANFYQLDNEVGYSTIDMFSKLLYGKETSLSSLNFSQKDLTYEFCRGKIAVMLNDTSQDVAINNKNPKFEWSKVPLYSIGETKNNLGYITGESFVIVSEKNKDEINDFINFLYTPKNQDDIVIGTGSLPVTEGLNNNIYMQNPYILNNYYNWNYIIEILQEGVNNIIIGKEDSQTLPKRLQKDIREFRLKY